MEEIWRKAMLFGMGVLDFTKEKMEDLVEEMIRRGEVSQSERGQAVEELMKKAQTEQEALFNKIKVLIHQAISQMGLAKASDLSALEKRVAALEEKVHSH
jgi:polyhydroxyalkanoate synthesis regulator phasin